MMGVMVTQGAADHDTHDVGERCWAVLLLERDESARIASASARVIYGRHEFVPLSRVRFWHWPARLCSNVCVCMNVTRCICRLVHVHSHQQRHQLQSRAAPAHHIRPPNIHKHNTPVLLRPPRICTVGLPAPHEQQQVSRPHRRQNQVPCDHTQSICQNMASAD